MKAQKHITRSILCALTVIVCIAIFAACTFIPEAHMHEWSKWTVDKEPTCTVAGKEIRTCRGCGERETRSIDLLDHEWNEPTCTSPKTCAVCGTSTGEKLQHNYTREVIKKEALKSEATCTKAAVYYKSCACGKVSNSEKDTFVSGNPLAHTYTVEVVRDEALKSKATCTQAAVYYKSCSCGLISKNDRDIFESGNPLAHTYNQEVANEESLKLEATCTKAAVYYKSCSCGKVSTSENDTFVFGTPAPHVFDQEIAKDETLKSPATPTSAAVYYKSCVCGAISKDAKDTFTYGKPGDHTHSYTSKVTAPTCSEYGYTVYTCECGYTYTEIGTTLTEHMLVKNADPVLYLAKDATCDAPAEYYYSCSVCGACADSEGAKTFTDGEALGHDYVWKSNGDGTHIGTCQNYGCQKTVTDNCTGGAATCTQKAICEVCQEYYGEALGHNWKDGEVLLEATCTRAGQKTQLCQNEGCTATTTVTVPALGHTYQSAVTDPTCATQGYTTYTCQICNHSYVGDYQATLPHVYGEWTQTQAPTCTQTGIKTRTCSCGASETENVEALGHDYTSVVTNPTCTAQGYTTYTCQNDGCNHSYEDDYVTVSHQWNIEAPTCTQDQICSVCQAKNEATGHSYALSGSTNATCTKAATKTYTCANCEDSYTETVGTPTAHNIVGVTPTLTSMEGETCLFIEHYACADCGADVVGGEVEKHNNYVATIQTAATCTSEGVKVLTCADCGETKTETIPVDTTLGHAWVAGDIVDGKRIDTCSVCDTQKAVTIVTENQTNKAEDLKDTELSVGGTNINFGDAAESIGNQTQNDVTIGAGTLGEEEKQNLGLDENKLAQIGDNPIYNFTVTDTENNLITNFGEDVYVTISIPYTLKDGEDIDSIAVWFISDSGEIEAIPATYNNGYITFKTNHFSYYTATDLDPDERCALYGHNFKFGLPVAPTCTESGYTLRYCIRCSYSDKVDEVDPIGHDFQAQTVREATCAQEGLIKHTCSGCRQSYEERIPVLEHDYQLLSETNATCTVAGAIIYKCTLCQNEKVTQIDPLGHDCKATQVIAPTCTTKGYTVYVCQNSGCTYSYMGDYKNVVSHSFGSWTVVRPATCIKTGVQRRNCIYCNRSETQIIPIADHTYAAIVTAPTCATAGYTTYTCTGCQTSYVGNHTDPTGHKYTATWEWAEDNSSAQITISCENEGCSYGAEPVIETIASKCTVFDSTEKKEGRKEYTVHYEYDGESFSDTETEIIPKKEHDHKDCEWQYNKFNHWYKCSESKGNSQKIPHVFDNGTVIEAATCQKAGKILYKCECGYEKTEPIPKTDAHVAGDQTYHDGEKHWNVCTECSQKFGEAKHEWDDGTETKGATCTEKGSITYTCACGATKDVEIPALGHIEEIVSGKEATCTEDGLTEGKKCSACGIVTVPQTVISAPGHKFEDGYCTECGLSEIPPHDHFFDNACDTDCNFDGCKFTRDTEHVFDHDCDEECNECGFARKTEHVYDNACDPDCNINGCGYIRMIYTHYFDHDCDEVCNECGYVRYVEHIYDNICDNQCNNPYCNYVRTVSDHEYRDGYCIYCGASEVEPHEHFFSDDCDVACDFEGCHFTRVAPHVYSNDCDTTCDVCGCERWVPYHSYIETERLDATCTADGYVAYVCLSCGDVYTDVLYAHGHYVSDYVVIKEATCTEDGEQQGTCEYCGETITEPVWATGHFTQYEFADFAILGITCGGWSSREICQTCNKYVYFHVYDYYCAWEQTSYDEENNTYTYTCLNCGAEKKQGWIYDYRDTCHYTTTEFFEYYVGGELVWYGGSQWENESHTWEYTFELQGTSCADGYNATESCVDCGYISYTLSGDSHNYYCVERYEFADYGACYGYLYVYKCPCGEYMYTNTSYCGLNHVSSESYTNDAGVEHWLETYACPTCGLTRVRDYYTQREGCYTYCYETYTFQVGDTVIGSYENRWESNSHHEYEYTYVFDDEANRDCEAGVTVTQTCRNCDYSNQYHRWHHENDLREKYEFTEYGACYGYVYLYECPCGKYNSINTHYCDLSYVSATTYTDVEGREHTEEIYACAKCGLTRVLDYYDQREGCFTYRYYISAYKMGDTVIVSFEEKSQQQEHHVYEYIYVFDDEANQNCDAGVTVTQTCSNCDYRNESYRWYHTTDLIVSYDFTEYGACYGYLNVYSCPCGASQHINQHWCGMSYVSETTYTDAQGREHTVYTEACSTCGLTRVRDYYMQIEGCYTYRYTTFTFQINGIDIASYDERSQYNSHHIYEYTYQFHDEANQNCEAGVYITQTCRNCDYMSQWTNWSHSTVTLFELRNRYDCCDSHSICVYGCPCGEEYRIEFDGSTFVFDEQSQLYTCPDCAVTVAYSVTDVDANCVLTRTTSIVVKLANEELYSGTKTETFINHNFADVKVSVNGETTTVAATCQKCGTQNTSDMLVVELEDHDGTWYYDYYFTPDTTATYTVKGMMDSDTYVILYELVDGELVEIGRNDDDGGNRQFLLRSELTAGTTYVYRIRFYNSSNSGSINFILKQGELQQQSNACSHNLTEFVVLLDGSQNCEDGSAYARICKMCGLVYSVRVGNSHTQIQKEYYNFTEYGACYGYLYINECACGQERSISRHTCGLSYVSETTYTDAQGVVHTVLTEACSTCGLIRVRDYYEQREGCFTYRYYTYTYKMGDTVICAYTEKSQQQEHHVYEYTYAFDDPANQNCEAGVTVTRTCRNCNLHEEYYRTSHGRDLVERYDFTEYGACYGYLSIYKCACGENYNNNNNYCSMNYVSDNTYTDTEGREHREEIYACPTCGLTRVRDYYDQREGCYTYRYYTYTYKMGNTVIGSYQEKSQQSVYHVYEYTYVFDDETNRDCEAGVRITQTCRNCDIRNEYYYTYHNSFLVERYEFVDYGACRGYLRFYECPCGEYRSSSVSRCSMSTVSQETYVDANGITHTVSTEVCSTCGLTRVYDYYEQREGCFIYRYYTNTFKMGNTVIGCSYEEKSQQREHHVYEYIYIFDDEANQNCEAGVLVIKTCRECDYYSESHRTYHSNDLVERYDPTEYGACYGYLCFYACPCGESTWNDWNYCSLNYVSQTTYTDAQSREHYVETYACSTCGLTRTYDYYDQREGCYTYRYYTYTFEINNTVIGSYQSKSQQREYHVYEYNYVFDDETNRNCEAGVRITQTCRNCDYYNEWHPSYHSINLVERYEFSEFGGCYGYVRYYECPCGESSHKDVGYNCNFNYVSETTETNAQGVQHTVRTEACSTCGLTRVRDYYDQREGCYTYRYYTYTYKMGDTVIVSYEEKSQYNEHHVYEYIYVFDDETNRNCEAGVTVTQTCRNCDYRNEYYRTYHSDDLVERYDLTEYGACYGYLRFYACPCGESTWNDWNYCSLNYVSQTTYTDAQGREHYVETYACSTCGLTRVYDYYDQREGCYTNRYYTYTFKMNDVEIGSYQGKSQQSEYHVYEYNYVFDDETNRDCEAGVRITQTCRNCDIHNEYYYTYHNSFLVERYEFVDYGACRGYLRFYECPCGEYRSTSVSRCSMSTVSQETYVDANGITHTVSTEACSTCGLTRVRDYYDQREGCYTYRYYTYTFKMGNTVIGSYQEKSQQNEYHVYEYNYVFDDETNRDCEAGVRVTQTCRNCDIRNEYYYTYHNSFLVERYEFVDYGACRGYLRFYECPCGEYRSTSVSRCSMSTVSQETYVDANGITHTVSTEACSTCGLTRVRDYYDQREGCFTYRYYTYTFKMGNTVIGCSYEEKSQINTHHQYEYTYVFDDENNKNCEAGVTVTRTCRNCDYYDQYHRTYHSTNLIERYDLSDYGADGGYVEIHECPCGYSTGMNFSSCSHGYTHTSEEYVDESGTRWYVETRVSTCDCKIRYDRAYYHVYDRENCTRTTYYGESIVVGDTIIKLYNHSNNEKQHDYEVNVSLAPGATSCTEGVTATYVCRYCDYSYTSNYSWHQTYEKERIDMAQYGSVCGGYISIQGCACGIEGNWYLDNCDCGFEQRGTNNWVQGDINNGQYTANGWNSFYTNSYIFTCFVTNPEKCGFVIRHSNYWVKNSDCTATHYVTIQFGYDEATGTYLDERTIRLETRTYHNYVQSQIQNGTKHECSDCGSYYTECYYYNANGAHIKTEYIYVNTLNDGHNKYRQETYEYFAETDYRWNGNIKTEYHKTIDANDSEYWYQYEHTYADYTAPFGENAYKHTRVYTDSNGSTDTYEWAYTTYKGYSFYLFEHREEGDYWWKYDYTYNFIGGCLRTCVYTTSSGERRVTTEEAHPTWSYETVIKPTCTQFGLSAYHCPFCEENRDGSAIRPTAHNWVLLPSGIYYCYNCGLQNTNGASGSIVMEDFTEKYGNGTAYVIGYWQRIPIAFTPYVTIHLHTPIVIDGVPEQSFILRMSEDKFHFVNDEYFGLYVNIADIETAVAELCELYGVATFTSDMYDVGISFVPDGADGRYDYAIIFGDLIGSDNIDYIIREDEFVTDYVSEGGYVEYTVVSDVTTEWAFESYAGADTYVHLLDENGNEVAYDDDSAGYNNNFRLVCTLEAGKTYTLRVRWYNTQTSGYIPVAFDKK